MTYGSRIRQAREDLRMTQEQLAGELGASRQAVGKWEAGLSRPTRENLDKLSDILDIPRSDWAEINAHREAASRPAAGTSRPWRAAAAVLAVACALLAAALVAAIFRLPASLHAAENTPPAAGDPPADVSPVVQDPYDFFPGALPLSMRHDYEFGDIFFGEYEPELVPFLNDLEELQENELAAFFFGDTINHGPGDSVVFMSAVRANTRTDENGTAFSDVYLLCAVPDRRGDLDYQIMFRMAEENHYVNSDPGAVTVEPFFNVLGHDGFKISIVVGASGRWFYYITQRPDGTPCLMSTTGGMEADVDEDGQLEIICHEKNAPKWEIIDTEEGVEGAYIYTLSSENRGYPGVMNLALLQEKGGFVVPDSNGKVLGRYVLRDGALVRLPLTDFSVLDYPDAAGTKLTFITDDGILSDGLDPDALLPYTDTVRVTHRQQAYLALQELYELTGLKVDECYCAASEYSVYFSLLPDGFDQRSFYDCGFNTRCGNADNIPTIRIVWKELGSGWSPLSLADAVRPESFVKGEEESLLWYYERMKVFRTGEPAYASQGELWLENGDLYLYDMLDTKYGSVLASLTGPYPDGVVNH